MASAPGRPPDRRVKSAERKTIVRRSGEGRCRGRNRAGIIAVFSRPGGRGFAGWEVANPLQIWRLDCFQIMYQQFYGLRELPFELTPNPKYLFLTPQHREALSTLVYGLSSGKGVTALIG